MLAEQRKKHLSNITRSIHESKAEKCINRLERLDRDRKRLPVSPRKQPRREAAAEFDYCHSDSEDLDSDVSTSSVGLEQLVSDTPYGFLVTDTENISGIDKEDYSAKAKRKRKRITKPRSQPRPVLDRCKSVDCHAQKCVIQAGHHSVPRKLF